jgi:hypothetical protein
LRKAVARGCRDAVARVKAVRASVVRHRARGERKRNWLASAVKMAGKGSGLELGFDDD